MLISRDEQTVAFRVDEIVSEKELVVKSLDSRLINTPDYLRGAVLLGDGRLLPVLDGTTLVERCTQMRYPSLSKLRNYAFRTERPKIPTVMIIDDSLTIRGALSLSLRKEGYQVLQAKDGWEAMSLLDQFSEVSAVICDIEMPHMNGLEFLSRCKRQGAIFPIIILTYRNSQRYRLLAEQLGAYAYMTKPYLDKELLQVLQESLTKGRNPTSQTDTPS